MPMLLHLTRYLLASHLRTILPVTQLQPYQYPLQYIQKNKPDPFAEYLGQEMNDPWGLLNVSHICSTDHWETLWQYNHLWAFPGNCCLEYQNHPVQKAVE